MALGSTQPLTEMSTTNISLMVKAAVRRADNLTTFMCLPIVSKTRGHNLLEPSGPVQNFLGIALPLPLTLHLPT